MISGNIRRYAGCVSVEALVENGQAEIVFEELIAGVFESTGQDLPGKIYGYGLALDSVTTLSLATRNPCTDVKWSDVDLIQSICMIFQ